MAIEYDRQEILDPGEDSESADEEILFDRTGLLNGKVARRRSRPVRSLHIGEGGSWSSKFNKLLRTLALCLAFFVLGLCIAVPGPTLLDLQKQVDVSVTQITSIFTARSSGYLIGSLFGGVLFDRYDQRLLLFASLTWTAIAVGATPWCKTFGALMTAMALMGAGMGFLDTGGNVMCIEMWGDESGPYMQALHFSFGLGAFVAPLLAEPFLAPQINPESNDNVTPVFTDLPKAFDQLSTAHHALRVKRSENVSANVSDSSALFNVTGSASDDRKGETVAQDGSGVRQDFSGPGAGLLNREVSSVTVSNNIVQEVQRDSTVIGISGSLSEVENDGGKEVAKGIEEKVIEVPEFKEEGSENNIAQPQLKAEVQNEDVRSLPEKVESVQDNVVGVPESVVGKVNEKLILEEVKAADENIKEGTTGNTLSPTVTEKKVEQIALPEETNMKKMLDEVKEKNQTSSGNDSFLESSLSRTPPEQPTSVPQEPGTGDPTERKAIQEQTASSTNASQSIAPSVNNVVGNSPENATLDGTNVAVNKTDSDVESAVSTTVVVPTTSKKPPKPKPQVNDGGNLDNSVDWNNVRLPNPTPEEVKPTTTTVTSAAPNITTTTPDVTNVTVSNTSIVGAPEANATVIPNAENSTISTVDNISADVANVTDKSNIEIGANETVTQNSVDGNNTISVVDNSGNVTNGNITQAVNPNGDNVTDSTSTAKSEWLTGENEKVISKEKGEVEENMKIGNEEDVKAGNSTDSKGVNSDIDEKNVTEVFAKEGNPKESEDISKGDDREDKNGAKTEEKTQTDNPKNAFNTERTVSSKGPENTVANFEANTPKSIPTTTVPSNSEEAASNNGTVSPLAIGNAEVEAGSDVNGLGGEPGYAEGISPSEKHTEGSNGSLPDPNSLDSHSEKVHKIVGRPRVKEESEGAMESTTSKIPSVPSTISQRQRIHYSKPENTYSSSSDDSIYPLDEIAKTIQKYGVTKIHIVYIIIAVLIFHVALMFLCFVCSKPGREVRQHTEQKSVQVGGRVFVFILVSLLSVFFFLYVGMEVAYGQLVMTFSVHSDLHLTKSTGSFITAMFWGSFAAMRFLSIFLARVLKPVRMIILDFVLVSLGCLALSVGGSSSEPVLWIGSALVGAGMASIFPSGFLWAEQYIAITNKIASVFVVGAAAGEMVCPLVVGLVMENQPMALMHQLTATNILCILTFLAAWGLVTRRGRREQSAEYQMAEQHDEDELVDFPQLARRLRANA